jgi:hypothetical protein
MTLPARGQSIISFAMMTVNRSYLVIMKADINTLFEMVDYYNSPSFFKGATILTVDTQINKALRLSWQQGLELMLDFFYTFEIDASRYQHSLYFCRDKPAFWRCQPAPQHSTLRPLYLRMMITAMQYGRWMNYINSCDNQADHYSVGNFG